MCAANDELSNLPASSVLINWPVQELIQRYKQDIGEDIVRTWLEYLPPKGQPASPILLNGFSYQSEPMAVNHTWPAVGYDVKLIALLRNGTKQLLVRKMVYSSPAKPRLISFETLATTLALSFEESRSFYKASGGSKRFYYTYYIEYFRVNSSNSRPILDGGNNKIFFIRTNSTSLQIRNLMVDTKYFLRVFSTFFGVRSLDALEVVFQTNVTLNSSEYQMHDINRLHTVKNSADFDGSFAERPTEGISYSLVTAVASPLSTITDSPFLPSTHLTSSTLLTTNSAEKASLSSTISSVKAAIESNVFTQQSGRSTTPSFVFPPTTRDLAFDKETTTIPNTATKKQLPEAVEREEKGEEEEKTENIEGEIVESSNLYAPKVQENAQSSIISESLAEEEEDLVEENTSEEGEEESESEKPLEGSGEEEKPPQTQHTDSTAIHISLEENGNRGKPIANQPQLLRVEWKVPESALCDTFVLNYTIIQTSLDGVSTDKKTFTIASADSFAQLKFLAGAKFDLHVLCMFEGAISSVWSAHRLVDLSKPRPIENLQVKHLLTDERYVASVELAFDWPVYHDFNFYEKVVGKNELQLTNAQQTANISGLDPAQLYTFTVRNASKELSSLVSATIGLRQITPPVITSTLYPGQLSSNAININFGESDPEHPFDHYELVFSGRKLKNVTKKLQKNDPKSFNFNKLVPGKTYRFVLYTVYKGIRSRPVVMDITTYPLKVNKFYPVLGPNYATLYWDVENFADNHCRFRLDYSSTSNKGIRKSQTVNLTGSVHHHRFTGLDYDTFYTFTIIVIMGRDEAEAESESETANVGFMSSPQSTPSLKRYGSRELAITFENDHNIFADTNGVIDSFAIIVSEDLKLGGDDFELKSWYDVHEEEIWPAYRTSLSTYQPFQRRGSSHITTFIIGDEDCVRRKLEEPYCNGPLRAHTDYHVKIRAYSVSNVAMETDWTSVDGNYEDKEKNNGDQAQRRLPCHMYLNGCNSGSIHNAIKLSFRIGAKTSPITYTEDQRGCYIWTKTGRTIIKEGIDRLQSTVFSLKLNLAEMAWIGNVDQYEHICVPKMSMRWLEPTSVRASKQSWHREHRNWDSSKGEN
uniref:protein-tyrosine-phosphatase n=1 Tax=Ditylenchus dipsaci TaxID=166011 RepID=A0A915D8S9_9BILA